MKVLLVSANVATTPYPVYPLGMSMIAAALKDVGHDVEMFDFLHNDCSLGALAEFVRDGSADLVGISIRNIDNVNAAHEERYVDCVQRIVEMIRANTAAPVVLGGSGFSVMPEAMMAKSGADYGVVGEGEALICSLVEKLEQGAPPEERLLRAHHQLQGKSIPSAHYEPAILDFYKTNGRVVSVQTKRGCNKHCLYCSYPVLEGREIRPRDSVEVVDDIERLLNQHEAEYLFFVDSVFNDDQGLYRQVVAEMARRNMDMKWTAFFTPNGELDDEVIAEMKATGLHAAEIGADASTDITLKAMAKDFRWADVQACNERFASNGVVTAHYYMFGGPGETPDTVEKGIQNIRSLPNTANFMFMGIRILPHTPLMQLAIREGIISPEHEILEPIYYFSPNIDRDELYATLESAFADRVNCVFPPDSLDEKLKFLHRMGVSGSAYEMLIGGRRRRRNAAHLDED